MLQQENKDSSNFEEDSIDIIALIKKLWIARTTILKTTLVFLFLGLFIAIFSENQYTASTTFVPINQGKSSGGSLSGLASLAGINLSGAASDTKISPELYPEIFSSIPFQMELLNTPLSIEGQESPVSYKEYYTSIYSPGLLGNLKKYTIGLPSVIFSALKSDSIDDNIVFEENQLIRLSSIDRRLTRQLEKQLLLTVNAKEGYITIAVTLPEAAASAQMAQKAQTLLQDYALKFQTQKSIEEFNFIEDRFQEKENEFNKIKIDLARFQDQNSAINTALGKTKLLQLQSQYNLVFAVYSELAKQLETQRLQVKKDTPIFTVLKPVTIPSEKAAPKRALILVVYLFLGFVLSLGYVLVKEPLQNILKEIRATT